MIEGELDETWREMGGSVSSESGAVSLCLCMPTVSTFFDVEKEIASAGHITKSPSQTMASEILLNLLQ
jgi:hypothetical protein